MSNQDELRGFWASRETCTPPNKDHDEQVALHSRFKDITDQDLIRLEGSQPPKLSGGNLTPVAPVRTPIGAVYYKFLSLTASTIFHTGSNQLYLTASSRKRTLELMTRMTPLSTGCQPLISIPNSRI